MSLVSLITIIFIALTPSKMLSAAELSSQDIEDICNSNGDIYLVDIFQHHKPTLGHQQTESIYRGIDVDGDGLPDMLHGDFVAKVFELNHRPLKTYGIVNFGKSGVQRALGDLRHYTRINKIKKPAAIILALSQSFSLEKIKIEVLRDKELNLTFDNISLYKDRIISGIKEHFGDDHSLYSFYRDALDLTSMGIPIIVASGNDYSTTINLASIMGTTSLGALDLNNEIAVYSNQNPYVKNYRPGDFIGRKVDGGIDINNDGTADFPSTILSGQKSLSEIYNNTLVKSLDISEVDDKLKEQFFISSQHFQIRTGVGDQKTLDRYDQNYGDITHYPSNMSFFTQEDGTILFNPAQDSSTNQVSLNFGTSLSIGNLCYSK